MAEQTIQSQDIKVAEVFQAFYAVPDYQREYVWESDQVEQLLTDIYNEVAETAPGQAPEHFIGSIVVCPGERGVLPMPSRELSGWPLTSARPSEWATIQQQCLSLPRELRQSVPS